MKKFCLLLFLLLGCISSIAQISHQDLYTLSDSVQEAWVARYDGLGNGDDRAVALAVDDSGNVYVTGYSTGINSGYDYTTIKYNNSGVKEWEMRYNGPGNGADKPTAMKIDTSGNIYVTGSSLGANSIGNCATIKYTAAGNEEWVARYNGPANSGATPYGLDVDNLGNIYITGSSSDSVTDKAIITIKYNSSGTEEWVARYNSNYNGWYYGQAISVRDPNNIYVIGSSEEGYSYYPVVITIKYDSTGNMKWTQYYTGYLYLNYPCDIKADHLGDIYVLCGRGLDYNPVVLYDYVTIKYNASGTFLWSRTYDGIFNNSDDEPAAMAVDKMGNVYVTGSSNGLQADYEYATVKYKTNGVEQWVNRYGNQNYISVPSAIATDTSGNVYVTGYSGGNGTANDYTTIKYNSTGTQEWLVRYNGQSNKDDFASAITVDDSGNVYLTGYSNNGTNFDYVTIKYRQIPILIPLAPTNLQASVDTLIVSLSWNDNSDNEEGFVIQRKTGDSTSTDPFIIIDTVGQNITACTDTSFNQDTTYSYRVYAYNSSGTSDYSNIVSVQVPFPTGVKENINIPLQFSLEQNYPNPFNPSTVIGYQIPVSGQVTLKVYNILGREVATLVNEYKAAGKYEVEFSASGGDASNFSSGIYFYKLEVNSYTQVKKMLLLK